MFDVVTADEIMRRDLITLSPSTSVLPAISKMLDANISGAPVVDETNRFLGVFSEKCSLNALTSLVEEAAQREIRMPEAKEFMTKRLVTLTPDWDVFAAIDHILEQRISGAPVVDEQGGFVGVFSEKTAMRVLMAAIHDSVPGSKIEAFLNLDRNRVIRSQSTLTEVATKFQQTPYRRLPVLNENHLLGQVSRRDVLRAELKVGSVLIGRANSEQSFSIQPDHGQVGEFIDREALTIGPNTDLLAIAQLFLNSTHRRLPVLSTSHELLGQISRRDLLAAASKLMKPDRERKEAGTLYLSQISENIPSSIK